MLSDERDLVRLRDAVRRVIDIVRHPAVASIADGVVALHNADRRPRLRRRDRRVAPGDRQRLRARDRHLPNGPARRSRGGGRHRLQRDRLRRPPCVRRVGDAGSPEGEHTLDDRRDRRTDGRAGVLGQRVEQTLDQWKWLAEWARAMNSSRMAAVTSCPIGATEHHAVAATPSPSAGPAGRSLAIMVKRSGYTSATVDRDRHALVADGCPSPLNGAPLELEARRVDRRTARRSTPRAPGRRVARRSRRSADRRRRGRHPRPATRRRRASG